MSRNPIYNKSINNNRWVKLRRRKIEECPLCEICLKRGKTTAATEVHHIVPIESAKDEAVMRRLAYDYSNLQSLCRECHHAVHDRDKVAAGMADEQVSDFFKSFCPRVVDEGGG